MDSRPCPACGVAMPWINGCWQCNDCVARFWPKRARSYEQENIGNSDYFLENLEKK